MPYQYPTPPGEKGGLDNAFYGFAVFIPVMMNRFLRRLRDRFLVADEYGRDTRAHCETANKQQDGSGKVFHLFQIWFGGHGKKSSKSCAIPTEVPELKRFNGKPAITKMVESEFL